VIGALHEVAPERSPLPAVALSLGLHAVVLLVVPWSGQAVWEPPSPGPTPFELVDVSDIAMPGTGDDPLSGPAGLPGGSPFGTPSGPPAPEGVDPLVVIPRSAVEWLEAYEASDPKSPVPPPETWHEHTPAVPRLQAPPQPTPADEAAAASSASSGVPVVGGVEGVPVRGPVTPRSSRRPGRAEPEAAPPVVDDGASAIRAAMLKALLEGGAEVIDEPIGLGSPSGEGGMGPFSGAGSRYGLAPDPELLVWQRLVQQQLMERFKPLPALTRQHPGLSVTVALTMGPRGAVLVREVRQTSGNASFDAAALWAVDQGALPPPPERWAELLRTQGLAIRFTPGGRAADAPAASP